MAHIDEWIYSLISVQTMSGYGGTGYYGISRMNGGAGSRSVIELVRDRSAGQRWIDAVSRLLEHRKRVLEGPFGYDPKGPVLVWLEPWDGRVSLDLAGLDPFYIEICRRIRLRGESLVEHAEVYRSWGPRIAAKALNGIVGDPWLAIDLKDGAKGDVKALTFPPTGVTAEHMHRLIFEDELQLHALQRPRQGWNEDLWLSVSVLAGGQCTTNGFHEREVRIPKQKTLSVFGPPSQKDALKKLGRNAMVYAATMLDKVLKPAVRAYIIGASEGSEQGSGFANAMWRRSSTQFELRWSDEYFTWLFSVPEAFDEEKQLRRWVEILRDHALAVLEEAELSTARRSACRYRTRTNANGKFWGAFYDHFAFMKERDVNDASNATP